MQPRTEICLCLAQYQWYGWGETYWMGNSRSLIRACLDRNCGEDTPASLQRDSKIPVATVYWWVYSEYPSVWESGHREEGTMAISSSLQGRLTNRNESEWISASSDGNPSLTSAHAGNSIYLQSLNEERWNGGLSHGRRLHRGKKITRQEWRTSSLAFQLKLRLHWQMLCRLLATESLLRRCRSMTSPDLRIPYIINNNNNKN